MQVLVTAFEPFGGEHVNASLEAVRRLPSRIGTLDIRTVELPTSYARSLPVLESAIARTLPEIVLCVGQAGDRAALCVERVAINVQDSRLADNDGAMPIDVPVVPGAPAAYFATLPVKAAVLALQAAGLPAEVSNSAGTFVCNHVFYGLMHYVATQNPRLRGGLLHVPCLREHAGKQAARDSSAMPMARADIVRGIIVVLETAAGREPGTP